MFAGPIVFIIFIVTCSFAEESSSNDVSQEKRAPMGFQGMRGKKDLTSSENDEYSKRAPMGFQGMRGKKIIIGPDIEESYPFENSDKRAPMGFQGMRGKKEYLVPIFEDPYYNEDFEKRAAMMGFQGMRGKKNINDDEFDKRGPMGFQGVRGKKSLEEILEDMEKRSKAGFHGTRGKKSYAYDYPDEFEKRALAMGFQGMRGKREEFNDEWEKRAPMGFQGMRGKKNALDDIQELQKRAIMGFQGVRGKRNIEQSSVTKNEGEKRKLLSFQGPMRDREDSVPQNFEKRSPFWHFGSRGKKNPRWEFRGKFVGVRGKKWVPSSQEDESRLKNLFDNIERLNRLPGYTSLLEMQ
ncbi:tachykinins isoform X1 [Leptopilina boulardi]|uniref:tachykinins isoform X1 n=1 Tax=Leptopilina boulardi TaxID=63433 RepID=UPI0021F5FF4C|nr:tachykinins isoform X1 [Leptopilina boulardi]